MSKDGVLVTSGRERERPYDFPKWSLVKSRGGLAATSCRLTDIGLADPFPSSISSLFLFLLSSSSSSSITSRSLSLEVDSSLDLDSTSVDDKWLMEVDFVVGGGESGGRSG